MSGATPTMFCSSKLNARTVRVRDDGPKDGVREKEGRKEKRSEGQTDMGESERRKKEIFAL